MRPAAPDIPVRWVAVDGVRLRYVVIGSGQPLVLLHTLRTLVHHWPTWEAVRQRYGDIDCPVLLLYADHDWSRPDERAKTARLIPGAEVRTVKNAGHFLGRSHS